jgi:hypothetical protein
MATKAPGQSRPEGARGLRVRLAGDKSGPRIDRPRACRVTCASSQKCGRLGRHKRLMDA